MGSTLIRMAQVYRLEQRLAVASMRLLSTGVASANQAMPLPSKEKVL